MIPKSMFCKDFLRLEIQHRSDFVELPSTTMKRRSFAFLFGVTFLALFEVQEAQIMRSRRCSCINTSTETVALKSLKDLKQFAPSPSCEKTEIIATRKNGNQTCLNPDSAKVKELVKQWEKQVNQKKKQKKGKKHQKSKKIVKVKRSQAPHQKKTA